MTTTTTSAAVDTTQDTARLWAVALCWVAVALDGFDLVVIGAVIPTLSKTGALGFTDASLTTASTVGLVGVGIGAVLIGPLTDRFGRRRSLITCIACSRCSPWRSRSRRASRCSPRCGSWPVWGSAPACRPRSPT